MFTASVVTFRTPKAEIEHCVELFLASPRLEALYVVDNACQDSICAMLHGIPRVVYIPSPNNGYGAAHNRAIRRARGNHGDTPFHLVANTDIDFDPQVLTDIDDFMAGHPDIGCLQPRIVGPDGELQHTCRMLPTPADLLLRRFMPSWMCRASRDRYLLKHLDPGRAWNIPYHQGSFMFLRREALEEVGGFDERFFMYPEDIDLTRRIHRHWATVYWPGATVTHNHRGESYSSGKMLRVHMTNMVKYFNKWGWLFDSERRAMNRSIAPYRE